MRRRASVVAVVVTVSFAVPVSAGTATAEVDAGKAEIFATNETSNSFDPNDPALRTRLVKFAHQVDEIIRDNGGRPRGSTLLNGTFWSSDLKKADYERSREFHIGRVDAAEVRDIAHKVATRFHQQSVLSFQYLPRRSAQVNAILVQVPGVDFQRLHDAIEADPTLGERLGGGSVTLNGRLIEAGALGDLPLIKQLVRAAGGDWSRATIRYGAWAFVS
ncbi:hypothetical protein J4573_27545 [Actinomadura barringtoniae]|uniref:Uncharacterized protein n=1 Tax=Actinomadura barringtoniae TaxID=1427535 RepID=A0A939T6I7_9ACTN|nr:hypothetical protein [Actinomadura barringtoniae]MBO2450879.1 hypothetical protein [Actinomadura barringtoniae]